MRLQLPLNICSPLRVLLAVVFVILASAAFPSARELVWPDPQLPSLSSSSAVRSLPRIRVESPEEGTLTRAGTIEVRGRLAETELPACFSIRNGAWESALLLAGRFQQEAPLREGENRIVVAGSDLAGQTTERTVTVVRDSKVRVIELAYPPTDYYVTREPKIEIRGRLEDRWSAGLMIEEEKVALDSAHRFARTIALAPGENRIVLAGRDRAGNSCRMVLRVVLDQEAPVVTVISPPEGLLTSEPSVEVVCQVVEAAPSELLVADRRVAVDGRGRFRTRLPLVEGVNRIVIRGLDLAANRVATAVRTVICDRTAPTVEVISVKPGAGGKAGRVTVVGRLSEDGCTVTVGGTGATVRGKTFTAVIPREKAVILLVAARDPAGNETSGLLTPDGSWIESPYRPKTLSSFKQLVGRSEWQLADPPLNAGGMLEVVDQRTGLSFVLVPAGSFRMGSDHGDNDEQPVHEVKLDAFLLSRTECTQRAWDRVGGSDDRSWREERRPIEGVSWTAVNAWCEKAGLRLPSESEWEYGCRAGSGGKWCFGDDESKLTDYAVYRANSNRQTKPVGGKKANRWGLLDMHGNVWEWCADRWHSSYSGAPGDGAAWTTGGSSGRVARGGSLLSAARDCRSAYRSWDSPDLRGSSLGFRPARTGGY